MGGSGHVLEGLSKITKYLSVRIINMIYDTRYEPEIS
jgi:hypothetical protein